jgi:ABC-type enterochelin transport system ATPase subunit
MNKILDKLSVWQLTAALVACVLMIAVGVILFTKPAIILLMVACVVFMCHIAATEFKRGKG